MIKNCLAAGLQEPEFAQETSFRAIIWRKNKPAEKFSGEVSGEVTEQATEQATEQVSGEVTEQFSGEVSGEVLRLIKVLSGEMKRAEIQAILDLRHDDFFRINYIIPSLESGYIEMTFPESPNHPNQKYRLTTKGAALKRKLKKGRK